MKALIERALDELLHFRYGNGVGSRFRPGEQGLANCFIWSVDKPIEYCATRAAGPACCSSLLKFESARALRKRLPTHPRSWTRLASAMSAFSSGSTMARVPLSGPRGVAALTVASGRSALVCSSK